MKYIHVFFMHLISQFPTGIVKILRVNQFLKQFVLPVSDIKIISVQQDLYQSIRSGPCALPEHGRFFPEKLGMDGAKRRAFTGNAGMPL